MTDKYPSNDKGMAVFVFVTLFLIGPLVMLMLTGGNSEALLFLCFGGLVLFVVPILHTPEYLQDNILIMATMAIGACIFVGSTIAMFITFLT
ncbi:MAG: hypothetical protein OXI24_18855 [Candidatus Poribacteria bacterium]|nr:hypothetical protein [Candidatus Poribacteria bacterium]